MFNENLQIIKDSFSKYNGTGAYFILFLFAILFIFLMEKDKKKRVYFCGFSVLVLVIILNPLFNKCVNTFLNKNVYWRTFWILPIGITIAYAGTKLIKSTESTIRKTVAMLSLIVIIMLSGSFIYTEQNYTKLNNWYKIPDEYLQVINIIGEIKLENKKLMTSTDMVAYVRQIDATIKTAFPRRAYGDYDKYEIVRYYNAGDVENLINICKNKNVNILVYENSVNLTISPAFYGFELYAQTENFDIYVLNEK